MIEVIKVITKKQQKQFVDFSVEHLKNYPNCVPSLRMDELNLFSKKNASFDECEQCFFLAFQDGVVVGRIAGIIQKEYNKKMNTKRARFSRFDSINDINVAKALFDAAETWSKAMGMEIIHGPLGFNDMDREGMLIEGFEELQTFEEQFNPSFYPELVEACGFEKEIDWLEFRLYTPSFINERIVKISDAVETRYNLKIAKEKSKKAYIKKWKDDIFRVIDAAYSPLHGTVPYNEKMKKQILQQFNLFISMEYLITVLNDKDEPIAFGFAIPNLSEAMIKCKGRLTPLGLIRIMKAVKHPKILDLGLIGVLPEYQNKGINSLILKNLVDVCIKNNIEYCETNLNLETNIKVMQQWEIFEKKDQTKRRRCYVKKL